MPGRWTRTEPRNVGNVSEGVVTAPAHQTSREARGSRAPQKGKIVGISTILPARGHTASPISPQNQPYPPTNQIFFSKNFSPLSLPSISRS